MSDVPDNDGSEQQEIQAFEAKQARELEDFEARQRREREDFEKSEKSSRHSNGVRAKASRSRSIAPNFRSEAASIKRRQTSSCVWPRAIRMCRPTCGGSPHQFGELTA